MSPLASLKSFFFITTNKSLVSYANCLKRDSVHDKGKYTKSNLIVYSSSIF